MLPSASLQVLVSCVFQRSYPAVQSCLWWVAHLESKLNYFIPYNRSAFSKADWGIAGEMVHLVKALATKSSQPEFSVHRPQNGRRELIGTSWSLTVTHTRAYILTPHSNIISKFIKGCKSQTLILTDVLS